MGDLSVRTEFGRRAPVVRDQLIVDDSEFLLAFHDGVSRGTMRTVGFAEVKGIPIRIVRWHRRGK